MVVGVITDMMSCIQAGVPGHTVSMSRRATQRQQRYTLEGELVLGLHQGTRTIDWGESQPILHVAILHIAFRLGRPFLGTARLLVIFAFYRQDL